MTDSGEWRCAASALEPGRSLTFRLRCGARGVSGFIVNHSGDYHAYVNRCAHAGTTLDTWPNEFFTENGGSLICSTHGALYEPATGFCTAGPCAGDRLTPLPVRREGDTLVVSCPLGGLAS